MEARLLARRGRFAEATERLEEAFSFGACSEAEALDLKARICAQQGLLLQAEVCWRKAQTLDTGNPTYADALTALRRSQRPFAIWRRAAASVVIAVLLLLIGMLAVGHHSASSDRLALVQRLTALEAKIGELRGPLDRTTEATALANEALAKVADLRNETERRQKDWSAQQEQSRDALSQAINARLKAESEQQHKTAATKLAEKDAEQKVRDEKLFAMLQKMQESLTALAATQEEEEDRMRGQTQ